MPDDVIKSSLGAKLTSLRALATIRRRLAARDRVIRERRLSDGRRPQAPATRPIVMRPRREVCRDVCRDGRPEDWGADD